MTVRTSSAEWKGTLKEGSGSMKVGSGAYEGPFTYASRFESGPGTNPEIPFVILEEWEKISNQ